MALYIFCVASPFFTFLVHLVFCRIFFKWVVPKSPQNFLVCLILFLSLFYSTGAYFWNGSIFVFLYVFFVTLGFSYGYFHVFNMSETARRIHLLVTTYEKNYLNSDSAAQDLASYGRLIMLEKRLERLDQMGAAYQKNGMWFSRPGIMLFMAVFMEKARKVFYPI